MRLDMELAFDKYCVVDGSPTTVLPAPRRRSKAGSRKSKVKLECENDLFTVNEDLTEISFNRCRSSSCKVVPHRTVHFEGHEVWNGSSVYQSSKEVKQIKRSDDVEERKKIEFSRSSATALSFGIIDSLCSSDEDNSLTERNRSLAMSLNSELSTSSSSRPQNSLTRSSHHRISRKKAPLSGLSAHVDYRENRFADKSESPLLQDPKITSEAVVSPVSDGNTLRERDPSVSLHKSLSAKLAFPHSPGQSESDSSRASSPKSRFSPVRKMFDPFGKSRSQRSPLSSANELGKEPHNGLSGISRSKTSRQSLLHDFSSTPHQFNQSEKEDSKIPVSQSSPAHLHGLLKLKNKHGAPYFEFSVKFPEDVYVAKARKAENALNWIYTFHSLHPRRKSNANGWGLKNNNREHSTVGQMQVSCYLCTELKGAGAFDNSMVTEFLLYDIAHPRKCVSSQDNSSSPHVAKAPILADEILSQGNCELDEVSANTNIKGQIKHAHDTAYCESSAVHPLAAVDLHPELEIAAIIVQVPFEKRESLKLKSKDRENNQPLPNLLDLCELDQEKEGNCNSASPGTMHVVIPSGNHSLPTTESHGPSPLLDRWRLGGGCDCGGWDMACPLSVLGNPKIQIAGDHSLMDKSHPLELFVQGSKDVPALTMRTIEVGHYAVDFHARLSSLQAFSVCVAVLHTLEATTAIGQERNKEMLQCDSLRVFAEEEIKNLIDAAAEEEKGKVNKKMEDVLPSFVLNPPFSPIARV